MPTYVTTEKHYGNAQKAELSFQLNSFGKPQMYSGKEAWARQILQLMFYEPGTFPSDYNIGAGIAKDTYQTEDYVRETIVPQVMRLVKTYLPDIPFEGITIEEVPDSKDTFIYNLAFTTEADTIEVVTVAVSVKDGVIDYSQFIT